MAHPNPRMLIPIVVIAALGFGGWYVEKQRARTHSALSGFFESQPIELASRIGGRAAFIYVREGDSVKAGQPLIRFEANSNQAETAAKEAQAKQALEQYREVRNGARSEDIKKQEAVVAELRANLTKLRNGALPEEIGAARAKAQEARAAYQKALAGARPQEIEETRAAERNARAKLAQAERGLTPEEKAQAAARLESALAKENLSRKELDRSQTLYNEGAISKQALDRAQTDFDAAVASRKEAEEANQRAQRGTPPEEMEQARQAYRQAQAALALVQAGSRKEDIAASRAELSAAEDNLKLFLRGTRAEDIRAAEARLAQADMALTELKRGNRQEQIAQARAGAKAAAENACSAKENLGEKILRAPKNGTVERRLIAVGDLVSPGTPAIRMADPNDLWLRVYVPESQLSKVAVGDDAELSVDGVNESLAGVVESISTRGEFTPANLQTPDERGKQVFAVRIRLKHPDPRVKAGMYLTVKRIGRWTVQ